MESTHDDFDAEFSTVSGNFIGFVDLGGEAGDDGDVPLAVEFCDGLGVFEVVIGAVVCLAHAGECE